MHTNIYININTYIHTYYKYTYVFIHKSTYIYIQNYTTYIDKIT